MCFGQVSFPKGPSPARALSLSTTPQSLFAAEAHWLAKGIETVRRDQCPFVAKTMERVLRNVQRQYPRFEIPGSV